MKQESGEHMGASVHAVYFSPTGSSRTMAQEVASASVEPERMSIASACQLMRNELGEHYDTGTYGWFAERYSDAGVPKDVVQRLIEARRQALEPPTAPMGLRVVGSDL